MPGEYGDHLLRNDLKGYRSLIIANDLRLIYYEKHDIYYFVGIGKHTVVYKNRYK